MQAIISRSYRYIRPEDYAGYAVERPLTVLTPQDARQGVISGRVLTVLTVSLMLAVTAGAILAAVHFFPA